MIETICSNCGNIRVFEDSFSGKKFKCPVCGNVIEIKPIEIEDVDVKDNISNASIENVVAQRRQELSDAQKHLSDKEKEKKEKRKMEDSEIERKVNEKLDKASNIIGKERVSAYLIPALYIVIVIIYTHLPDSHNVNELTNFIGGFLSIIVLGGWLLAIWSVIKYRNDKKKMFGDSDDFTFTEEFKDEIRKSIIHQYYPQREEEEKLKKQIEFEKLGIGVKKILYELEHPEEKQ